MAAYRPRVCRHCKAVAPKNVRKCRVCFRPLRKRSKQKHTAALKLPTEMFVEANGGYDGCWICRELGIDQTGKKLQRDHEHKGEGRPRGVLCVYHNRLLGARYTPELMAAYAKYLNRPRPEGAHLIVSREAA